MRVQIITILNLKTISSLARLTDPSSQQKSKLSDQQWCVWCCARSTGRLFLQGTILQCKKHKHALVWKDGKWWASVCPWVWLFSCVWTIQIWFHWIISSSCCGANHRNVKCSLSSMTVHHPLCVPAASTDHSVWVFRLKSAKTLKWGILHVRGVVYPLHNYTQLIEIYHYISVWNLCLEIDFCLLALPGCLLLFCSILCESTSVHKINNYLQLSLLQAPLSPDIVMFSAVILNKPLLCFPHVPVCPERRWQVC